MSGQQTCWLEGKILSMASREVLIKAVVQAIPTHTMSCFLLPKSLCDDLNSMVSKFWWRQKNDDRKLAWMRWEKLCTLKACGGMGFRDLRSFNLALLAKQGWRLRQQSNSLFYQVFKSKYFPYTSFIQAQQGRNPSYVWRNILAAQPIIKHGMRWQVGNGENICIWKEKWIPNPSTYQVISPRTLLPEDATVNVLIDADHGTWRSDLVRELFLNFEADIILSIPLSTCMPRDKLVWAATPNGKFTMKSAYWLALVMKRAENESTSGPSGQQQLWRSIWSVDVPNKIKNFSWRACQNILPTKANLFQRKVISSEVCEHRDQGRETISHVLLHCAFA